MSTTITNFLVNPSAEVDLTSIQQVAGPGSSASRTGTNATAGGWAVQNVLDGSNNQGNMYASDVGIGFTGTARQFIASIDAAANASQTCSLICRAYYTDSSVGSSATKSLSVTTTPQRFVSNVLTLDPAKTVNIIRLLFFRGTGVAWTLFTDAALIHEGSEPVDYFDGDSPNAEWTGTPHASTSILTLPARRIYPILKVGSQQRIGPLRAGKA